MRFFAGDLFAPRGGEVYDVIVCNPPYIPEADCETIQAEVLREPRMALCGGADGLDFYRRLSGEAPAHLAPGGWLLCEVGDGQAAAVSALFAPVFQDITVYRDLSGLARVVAARREDADAGKI